MHYVQSPVGDTGKYKIVPVFRKLIVESERYICYISTVTLEKGKEFCKFEVKEKQHFSLPLFLTLSPSLPRSVCP